MNWLNTKLIISALILAKLSLVSTEKGTVHKLRKQILNINQNIFFDKKSVLLKNYVKFIFKIF